MQEHRPRWANGDRPAQREADLPSLAALHDLLRDVGLLRLRHGVLAPTRAADDELQTIRRLRSWFGPNHEFTSILAGTLVAVLAHHGPQRLARLAEGVHPLLDRWVHRDGTPLTRHDLRREINRLAAPAHALDLVHLDWSGATTWSAGDSAQTLLHRATALAHIWNLPRYRDHPAHPYDGHQGDRSAAAEPSNVTTASRSPATGVAGRGTRASPTPSMPPRTTPSSLERHTNPGAGS